MATLYVQFSDATKIAVVSWFASPQDPSVYSNLGTIDSSSPIWKSYYNALPLVVSSVMPSPV